jgi:hypothetical protein
MKKTGYTAKRSDDGPGNRWFVRDNATGQVVSYFTTRDEARKRCAELEAEQKRAAQTPAAVEANSFA